MDQSGRVARELGPRQRARGLPSARSCSPARRFATDFVGYETTDPRDDRGAVTPDNGRGTSSSSWPFSRPGCGQVATSGYVEWRRRATAARSSRPYCVLRRRPSRRAEADRGSLEPASASTTPARSAARATPNRVHHTATHLLHSAFAPAPSGATCPSGASTSAQTSLAFDFHAREFRSTPISSPRSSSQFKRLDPREPAVRAIKTTLTAPRTSSRWPVGEKYGDIVANVESATRVRFLARAVRRHCTSTTSEIQGCVKGDSPRRVGRATRAPDRGDHRPEAVERMRTPTGLVSRGPRPCASRPSAWADAGSLTFGPRSRARARGASGFRESCTRQSTTRIGSGPALDGFKTGDAVQAPTQALLDAPTVDRTRSAEA